MPCIKSQNVKFIYRVKNKFFLHLNNFFFLTMIRTTSQEEDLHLVSPFACSPRTRRKDLHWHVLLTVCNKCHNSYPLKSK